MEDEFGSDFITITDENGDEFELEHIDTLEKDGQTYMLFLPADMNEDDPDYGYIILRVVEVDGTEEFESLEEGDELNGIYDEFMKQLYDEDEENENG